MNVRPIAITAIGYVIQNDLCSSICEWVCVELDSLKSKGKKWCNKRGMNLGKAEIQV